ncbi:MAG: NAD-dependent epimerase/dehydratase family protein [Armatimonadetes bacterium]|nr:NAD-dependent epimerase/dehydratase family protein [Armatimonadota bacterium]
MKILITGGAGFIGSNVADRMIAEGHEMSIVDDLSTGFEENLPEKAAFYRADISDGNAIKAVFETAQPEVVIHHAAQMDVRRSTQEPVFDATVNIIGSILLLEECVRMKVKKVIYASTGGAVYGETQYLPADENHPINPISQYGISKHTVEHYLYLYGYNYGLKYTILRYPNVYGPRQNPHGEAGVVAIFSERMLDGKSPTIFGDGSQSRDYTFVGDIVEANLLALERGEGGIYNLGTGVETSVQQIFDTLEAILKSGLKPIYAPARLGEIQRICLTNEKAGKELGWQPAHTFSQGLEKTVAFYKEKLSRRL